MRTCVMTGASSGIGRATAIRFARGGYHVVLVARRQHELDATLELCGGAGRTFACDVADERQVQALAESVRATEGRCDVLVNNAGIGARVAFTGPESMPTLERVMRTNFTAAAHLTAELLGLLVQSAPAAIVNVSSVAGLYGLPGAPMYCASKFALTGFGEALHAELAPRGVHVVTVQPGPVPTEGFAHAALQSRGSIARRLLLADVGQVADGIWRAAHRRGTPTPVIPRTYAAGQLLKVLAPALYRAALRRVGARRAARAATADTLDR